MSTWLTKFMEKYENHLFRFVYFMQLHDRILSSVRYYVLRQGFVHEIDEDGTERKSGDAVQRLCALEHMGIYDQKKIVQYDCKSIKITDVLKLIRSTNES